MGVHQLVHHLERIVGFHRAVARIVVHIAHAVHTIELHTFFQQIFVDVKQARIRENFVKLVFFQLIHTRAARHDHGFDVQIVQRIGHSVEQYTVVRGDLIGFVIVTRRRLRIAAAQVARRQYGLHAGVIQHGLRRQSNLREHPLGTATREVEHGLGVAGGGLRIANDRHVFGVLNIE